MTSHLQGCSNLNYYARTGANGKRIRATIHSWWRVVVKSERERAIRTERPPLQHRAAQGLGGLKPAAGFVDCLAQCR